MGRVCVGAPEEVCSSARELRGQADGCIRHEPSELSLVACAPRQRGGAAPPPAAASAATPAPGVDSPSAYLLAQLLLQRHAMRHRRSPRNRGRGPRTL